MNHPKFRFLLRALLSFALIALLLSRLDWSAVAKLLRGVYLAPLVVGSLFGGASQLLMAERTRLMLQHWGISLSRASACSVTWVGQFCNNFLPGGMGGDMVKFYRVGRLYPHARAATLVALVADRLLALTALVALSAVAMVAGDRELLRQLVSGVAFGSLCGHVPAWWVAGLLVVSIAAFITGLSWRYRRAIIEKGAAHLQAIRDALAKGGRIDAAVAGAFILAVLVHTFGMLSALFFAHALAIPLGFGQVFLVWPVVLVSMMMPVSINGYGLREFILVYYFGRWQLTSHLGLGAGIKESVVALSLLTVLNDLVYNLPAGLLLLAAGPPTVAKKAEKPELRASPTHP